MVSISRKDTGKTYDNIVKPVVFTDDGDTWCFNTEGYGEKQEDFELRNIKVIENGIHRNLLYMLRLTLKSYEFSMP